MYTKIWDEIKNQIETISGGESIKYKKDFMKIRFDSDDDLHLGIPVVIIAVFQNDNKYYPQAYLHECGYEL